MSKQNSKILKNTFFMYTRMLLTLIISLYTSRVVLQSLGVTDFGIFNIVGGIVSIFSVIAATMTNSTQRFLSFEIGKEGKSNNLNNVFSMFILLHVIIAIIVLLFSETIGQVLFFDKLDIPLSRLSSASWVYQFSVISFCLGIIKAPFDACIIAKEDMKIYAYLGIFEVFAKLIIVFLLFYIDLDKLVLYAGLLAFVSFFIAFISIFYVHFAYKELKLRYYWDNYLFKSVFSYVGWNYLTAVGDVARLQGVNMILNIFFGPTVNAARGIAFQVQINLLKFVKGFQTSVNPQIVKYWSSSNPSGMIGLMVKSSKISYILCFLLTVPILANITFVLKFWLGTVPDFTVRFCELVLIQSLIECCTYPIWTAIGAIGNLKISHFWVSIFYLLIPIMSYFFFKNGADPYTTFYISIGIMIFILFFLIIRMSFLVPGFFNVMINNIFIKPLLLSIPTVIVLIAYRSFYANATIYSFLLSSVAFVLLHIVSSIFIGLNVNERIKIYQIIKAKLYGNSI